MAMAASSPDLRRAVILMSGTSFLVPAAGLLTAPILARGLSPDGRGELAAALAPALLMLVVATLGLPEALTFRLARFPSQTRQALTLATAVTLLLGGVAVGATWLVVPYLSGGDDELARLILVAVVVTVPALTGNVLRGAAGGLQRWGLVALERVVLTLLRLGGFVYLYATGQLTVWSALWVCVAIPLAASLVYLPLLRGPASTPDDDERPEVESGSPWQGLISYGARVWLGSIAGMLLARLSQLFMVPLSGVRDLGLLSVAITVADVPIIVAMAIQAAVFGVNSKTPDAGSLCRASRLTLLLCLAGCLVLGGSLPWWIAPVFGSEFGDALVPTWVLLGSAVLSVPGLIASGGLAAWGRPGLRSAGLLLTVAVNLVAFFLLVPPWGVVGGSLAALLSQAFLSVFTVYWAGRVMEVPSTDLWLIRSEDVRSVREVLGEVLRRRGARRPSR